jgi:hypothetical protein
VPGNLKGLQIFTMSNIIKYINAGCKNIWKTRNYIKYDKSIYREAIVITNLKNELRSNK